MHFHQFLDEHAKGRGELLGRIAGFDLFEHIPELKQDARIPEIIELRPGAIREYVSA